MTQNQNENSKNDRRQSFQKSLDRAAEIVSKWPDWKQNALGKLRDSSSSSGSSHPKTSHRDNK